MPKNQDLLQGDHFEIRGKTGVGYGKISHITETKQGNDTVSIECRYEVYMGFHLVTRLTTLNTIRGNVNYSKAMCSRLRESRLLL